MKYSEIKQCVRKWHSLGLTKIPGMDSWVCHFYLGRNQEGEILQARSAFSKMDLLYCNVPIEQMLDMEFKRYYLQARNKNNFSN